LEELRRYNAPNFPESSPGDGFAMKTRLQMVEMELQIERRRRVDAEQLVKDVERECREPFIVPALLDAFAAISRLSGEALI